MKFLSFGLVAVSSLFAAGFAAPTVGAPKDLTTVPFEKVPEYEVSKPEYGAVAARSDNPIISKIQECVVEVKKHTGNINSTVEKKSGDYSDSDKDVLVELVKKEVTIIIGLIHTLVGEVVELLSGTVEIVEEEKTQIIALVIELIFEILFTLKKVLLVLGITIFELLGPLIFLLLTVIGHLLCALNVLVEGLLKLVFELLAGVIELLLEVLGGLLPIILGIVGGLVNKVFSILSCLL